MKKTLTTIILIVITLMAFAGIANAATTETLADELAFYITRTQRMR